MSIQFFLYLFEAIFFALDAFRVSGPVSWTPAAFCLIVIALFLL